jgi:hypothetical protein
VSGERACGHSTRETEEALAWELIDAAAEDLDPEERFLTVDQIEADMADSLKEAARNPGAFDSDWALGLHQDCLLREAILTVGQQAVLARYPLPPEGPAPTVYPDGSRSDQMVTEEVERELERYASGLHADEVMLEVLTWSKAAQAAFHDLLSREGD